MTCFLFFFDSASLKHSVDLSGQMSHVDFYPLRLSYGDGGRSKPASGICAIYNGWIWLNTFLEMKTLSSTARCLPLHRVFKSQGLLNALESPWRDPGVARLFVSPSKKQTSDKAEGYCFCLGRGHDTMYFWIVWIKSNMILCSDVKRYSSLSSHYYEWNYIRLFAYFV